MNSLIVLLAVVAVAFAAVRYERDAPDMDEMKRKAEEFKNSCPGQCFQKPEYRAEFGQLSIKAQEWFRGAAQTHEAGGAVVIPDMPDEKWTQGCSKMDEVKTCVNQCNDAADAERKTKVIAILDAGKDLLCDETIHSKFNCIKNVATTPSETCNTQCKPQFDVVKGHTTEYQAKPPGSPPDFAKAKVAAADLCKLMKCRANCRKADIVSRCEQSGADAAKSALTKLATFAQTVHAQFRPAENFPEECKAAKLTEGL